ncbi:hypothetical protein Tco_1370965 [Tanacetum coccineum]
MHSTKTRPTWLEYPVSICHFVFLGTLATRKHRFSPFKPADEVNSSFRAIEVEGQLSFQVQVNPASDAGAEDNKVNAGVSDFDVLLEEGYVWIHEDGDNDAISGKDDEKSANWKQIRLRNGIAFINNLPSYCT